jgi:hypothetical protein
MDTFMAFEIVIAVETLGTLIAFKGSFLIIYDDSTASWTRHP